MLCKVAECVCVCEYVCACECLGYDYSLQCCHFAVFAFLWLQTRPPLDLASLPSCHTALSCTSCSRQELTEMQHKQHRQQATTNNEQKSL